MHYPSRAHHGAWALEARPEAHRLEVLFSLGPSALCGRPFVALKPFGFPPWAYGQISQPPLCLYLFVLSSSSDPQVQAWEAGMVEEEEEEEEVWAE